MTITALWISRVDESDPTALHCHYPTQTSAQACFVALDLSDGELSAAYDPEIGGGRPASVFHRRTLRWTIPPLSAKAANRLLEQLAPLAEKVLAGAEIDWDGHNNVGQLDAAATAAAQEITEVCEQAAEPFAWETVSEYDAGDWWIDGAAVAARELGITADTTDDRLNEIAATETTAALTSSSEGPVVLVGALEYLTGVRAGLRADS